MRSFPFDNANEADTSQCVSSDILADYYNEMNGRVSGIYSELGNKGLVVTGAGMTVKVMPVNGIIEGRLYKEESERTLIVQASEAQDRIDSVVIRQNKAAPSTDLYIIKGTAETTPKAPTPIRTGDIYDLIIAQLFIAKNTTDIKQDRITDTRLNAELCGLVAVPTKVDVTSIFNQYQAALDEYLVLVEKSIDKTMAGHLQEQIDEKGIQTYTHTKTGTTHNLAGTGANGKFKATAAFKNGDKFAVNGTVYPCYAGEDFVDELIIGRWYTFIFDGTQINFKSGGTKLKYKVVGGLEKPVSPEEGTIWVKTDVPIKKSYVVNDLATITTNVGDVIIKTSDNGIVNLVLMDDSKNNISVKMVEVFQNIAGTLASKHAYVCKNNQWESLTLVFFQSGKQIVPMLAQPLQYSTNGGYGSVTWLSDSARINCVNGYGSACIYPSTKIDMTPIKKVVMVGGGIVSTYGGITAFIMISPIVTNNFTQMYNVSPAVVGGGTSLILDTSKVTGEYYILFGAHITANIDSGYQYILSASAGT